MVIKLAKYIFPFFIIFGNFNLFCSEITSTTKNIEFNINHAEVISGFPIEGNLVIAKTKPENKVLFNNQKIQIDDSGIFIFGFHRDEESSSKLVIINSENDQFETIIQPIKREYKIQRIDGLEESKVTPPESVYKRIKEENNKIGEARAINSDLPFFKNQFIMPVEGIISGVYGSQRILNGKPKWPHYGIDIAAKQGTMIKSSGSGVVTMAEDDLYYTGGTIIMDHGHGISTIYSHLETVMVSVGDKINQGDIIGTVGSTGRSTGPHLDFRVNWFQTRLDPMSVLN